MGTMNSTALRPLTETERRAVDLMDAGTDIGDVAAETRLSRPQIVAARDLASVWTAVKRGAGQDAPVDPRPAITIEPQPAPEPEPLSDGPGVDSAGTAEDSVPEEPGDGAGPAPAVVGPGDAGALLERGRASANRRARDLAGSLDRYLAELAGILDAWGDEFDPYPRRELLTVNTGSEQWETLTTDDLRAVLAALDQQPGRVLVIPDTLSEDDAAHLHQRFTVFVHDATTEKCPLCGGDVNGNSLAPLCDGAPHGGADAAQLDYRAARREQHPKGDQ